MVREQCCLYVMVMISMLLELNALIMGLHSQKVCDGLYIVSLAFLGCAKIVHNCVQVKHISACDYLFDRNHFSLVFKRHFLPDSLEKLMF